MSDSNIPRPQIFLHDTLKGKKCAFLPKVEGKLDLYGCGPTVYDLIHVGNARAMLTFDLLARVFEHAGYSVNFVRNYTDVDDKIIKKAKEEDSDASAVASKYIEEFEADMSALKMREPDAKPRVTTSMEEIIKMIESLVEKNHAYAADTPFGQDVYFRVDSFKDYGKLSKRPIDELLNQARIEMGEAKESPVDFALWKAAKEGEPSWDSPWGKGRPGWHIECSAMIDQLFPNGLDIHMGGIDLSFPHHENEIAQSEACYPGKKLANYWVHNGLLQIQRVKMSKSLGNYMTLRKFLEDFGPEVLRLLCTQTHYRSLIDFSGEVILRTEMLLEKLYRQYEDLQGDPNPAPPTAEDLKEFVDPVLEALYDDLNTAKALGLMMKQVKAIHKGVEQAPVLKTIWKQHYIPLLKQVYGLLSEDPETALKEIRGRRFARSGLSPNSCQEIEEALQKRLQLRSDKKFDEADKLREELEARGIIVMDGPDQSSWSIKGQLEGDNNA